MVPLQRLVDRLEEAAQHHVGHDGCAPELLREPCCALSDRREHGEAAALLCIPPRPLAHLCEWKHKHLALPKALEHCLLPRAPPGDRLEGLLAQLGHYRGDRGAPALHGEVVVPPGHHGSLLLYGRCDLLLARFAPSLLVLVVAVLVVGVHRPVYHPVVARVLQPAQHEEGAPYHRRESLVPPHGLGEQVRLAQKNCIAEKHLRVLQLLGGIEVLGGARVESPRNVVGDGPRSVEVLAEQCGPHAGAPVPPERPFLILLHHDSEHVHEVNKGDITRRDCARRERLGPQHLLLQQRLGVEDAIQAHHRLQKGGPEHAVRGPEPVPCPEHVDQLPRVLRLGVLLLGWVLLHLHS
mmetsp:Transcript_38780/g.123188  ORF Transcript_38780/g.123188 Transcript_38780/m.123188 type:complete len:352 (-) Transcript_38780:1516-2571(-)